MSITNLLCYIRRDRLTSWKLDSLDRHERHPVPAYGSNGKTFGEYARRRNIIWVVGAHKNGPPSLEAKISIAGPLPKDIREYCYEVYGTIKGSHFFGYNDASSAMMKLVFKGEDNWCLHGEPPVAVWKSNFGMRFQSPRRIALAGERAEHCRSLGARPLEQLEKRIRSRSVFISWKHVDHDRNRRRFIRALTSELANLGFGVWWDKTALTNVEATSEYCELQKQTFMNRLLQQGLKDSTAVLAFWTDDYGEPTGSDPNWTQNEWHKKGRLRIAISSGDFKQKPKMHAPNQVLTIPNNPDPDEAGRVARDFARVYDSIKGRTVSEG